MRHKFKKSYEWAMKQFGLAAWPDVMDPSFLPNDFVADGKN